jgi:hypothetical protein
MSGDPELVERGKAVAKRLAEFDAGGYPASDLDWSEVPPPPEPPDDEGVSAAVDTRRNGHHLPGPAKTQHDPMLADALLNRSALRALPDPEPLIDNVLDQGTTALLYGKHGTFKTFIAMDWAASVGIGRRWQGRNTKQRRVLYVAGEGAFGFKRRLDAWEAGWQTQLNDDDLHILPHPVNLTRTIDVAHLAALIEWNGYGLVVLDTLARCMFGADENSAKDCGIVVDAMTRLLGHTPGGRGVILGVHHSGKDGKTFRGSSVFEAGAETVYSTIRDGAVVILNREKRKDGPEYDRHELKLDPINGTGSVAISVHREGGQTERADKLLSTFVQHFASIGASKSELRNVAEMPSATFHRALSDLLKAGHLVNHATDQRPFYKQAHE